MGKNGNMGVKGIVVGWQGISGQAPVLGDGWRRAHHGRESSTLGAEQRGESNFRRAADLLLTSSTEELLVLLLGLLEGILEEVGVWS